MFKVVLICALVALAAGANLPVPRLDGRIVGGRPATIQEFPHQISLQFYGSHGCGGSVVDENHIITAAHCTDGMSASMMSVRGGSTRYSSGGQYLNVKRIIQHPSYDAKTTDYDISILELEGSFEFNEEVLPISVVRGQDPAAGTKVTVSGWGTTSEGGSVAPTLMAVDLNVIESNSCKSDYSPNYEITSRMICAGVGGGKDACQGDSGGPLIAGDYLVGVVSWGIGCARPNYPGVFSSVANLRSFIDQHLIV